ncbi:protein enabled isoform X1 [Onthophagus taurus]|uniref:protein enabled isoform X1 n=1 Tax=Onthophagus taurus TaxID=166361 RepID=UPI0039BDA74B
MEDFDCLNFYKDIEDHYNVELRKSQRKDWEDYWACEQSIASARASVMVYDDVTKKWIPSGSSSGVSKVQIYQHTVHQTFRVVGRKLQDQEVVINCAILKGLKYNQATATFHQWRDNKHVYGLNFSSKEDADMFARAMFHSLEVLSNIVRPASQSLYAAAPIQQQQQQPIQQQQPTHHQPQQQIHQSQQQLHQSQQQLHQSQQQIHQSQQQLHQSQQPPQQLHQHQPQHHQSQQPQHHQSQQPQHHQSQQPQIIQQPQLPPQLPQPTQYDEDMGYRTMTREDVAMIQDRRISSSLMSPQQTSPMTNNVPVAPTMPTTQPAVVPSPVSPPSAPVSGHQRTTSAPPAPVPPPLPMISMAIPQAPPAAPTPVPMPPQVTGPPPPPPPPMNMSRSQSSDGGEVNSLAAQLQSARLKKSKNTPPPPAENSGSSTSSGGSSNYGTLGRGGGGSMASMMDEMAKTLARRRAAVEKKTDHVDEDDKKASWEKTNTLPSNSSKFSSESPKSIRKRFGSASEETILKVNGLSEVSGLSLAPNELESLKNEIIKEVRKEIAKMKQDILDAIKSELNRR